MFIILKYLLFYGYHLSFSTYSVTINIKKIYGFKFKITNILYKGLKLNDIFQNYFKNTMLNKFVFIHRCIKSKLYNCEFILMIKITFLVKY